MQRAEERLSNARAQRNRLLAAFEGIQAAEDDMEAVIARFVTILTCITWSLHCNTWSLQHHYRSWSQWWWLSYLSSMRLLHSHYAVAMCSHYTVITWSSRQLVMTITCLLYECVTQSLHHRWYHYAVLCSHVIYFSLHNMAIQAEVGDDQHKMFNET